MHDLRRLPIRHLGLVKLRQNDPRLTYKGNYGSGIGNVWNAGKTFYNKHQNLINPILNKGIDKISEKGKDYYHKHKGEVKKLIKDKAEDIVESVIDKAEKKLPDGKLKDKIMNNSDLIGEVSKKLLKKGIDKGEEVANDKIEKIINRERPKRTKKVKGAGLMII